MATMVCFCYFRCVLLYGRYATLVGKLESRTLEIGRMKQRAVDAETALDASQSKLSATLLSFSQSVRDVCTTPVRVALEPCVLHVACCVL